MYNHSQYAAYANAYASAYPDYAAYGYQQYGYQNEQQVQPGGGYVTNNWTPVTHNFAEPPPLPPQEEVQNEGVVQEMQQQKAQLSKQREDYVRKASVLRKELEQLRQQKQDLVNDGRSDRELKVILKENEKLQEQIQGKLKAILNVIEMLSSIIKDGQSVDDLEAQLDQKYHSEQHGDDEIALRRSRTPTPKVKKDDVKLERDDDKRYSYVYYDTGLHWCRTCDEFPETAKSYLQHLQSKDHQESAKENEIDTTPWHKLPMEPLLPSYEDAPKKRVPIKGLQFFISAPSWYCKLCDVWIGDLHCASHHLKSKAHSQNYENFVEQNPHWEMEWLKDREKALTRNGKQDSSDSDDDNKKKRKRKHPSLESILKEKKKKRRSKKKKRRQSSDSSSSSSSSDSSSDDDENDKTRSIRVAMRNVPQVKSIMNEDMSKWNVLEKLLQEHRKKEATKEMEKSKEPDDELINQWMTVVKPFDKEKNMLDSLKDRMKAKQEMEKAKYAEQERQRKETERKEQEVLERKKREEKEAAERAEKERQRREQEEFQRITDKERNQVRFKTSRETVRRKRSASKSDEESERSHKEERHHRRESQSRDDHKDESSSKKKPPGPPSYKKLPFIGRMPLFKNKKVEEKTTERKEIKKAEYEPQRKTRFESGNLARAFIPQPDVVCFPVLSSIPPLTMPPPPPTIITPPEPPSISKSDKKAKKDEEPMAPPPPKIGNEEKEGKKKSPISESINEDNLYSENGPNMDPNMMGQYYQDYSMMYSEQYEYHQEEEQQSSHVYTMPLEPPPLPPDDDLAMLGICADDMAAQTF